MDGEQTLRSKTTYGQAAEPLYLTDEVLAVRGDVESFIRLYHIHVRGVYGYLLARLGNRQDAEDVTSEVFKRAWTSLPQYRPTGAFKGWLFTIAHRAVADHYRRHAPLTMPLDSLDDVLLDPATGLEDNALASEQVRQVFQIIAGLSHEQQEVLYLRFLADLSYDEIARVTGKRESAVKMMAYRALEEIRRRYHDDNQN